MKRVWIFTAVRKHYVYLKHAELFGIAMSITKCHLKQAEVTLSPHTVFQQLLILTERVTEPYYDILYYLFHKSLDETVCVVNC